MNFNRAELNEGVPITEQEVIVSLDGVGMEASLELLNRYIAQCQAEADQEYTDSGFTAIASHLANIRMSIKIAKVYIGSRDYKQAGVDSLRETSEAARAHSSASDLLLEIERLLIETEAIIAGSRN